VEDTDSVGSIEPVILSPSVRKTIAILVLLTWKFAFIPPSRGRGGDFRIPLTARSTRPSGSLRYRPEQDR